MDFSKIMPNSLIEVKNSTNYMMSNCLLLVLVSATPFETIKLKYKLFSFSAYYIF